MYIHVRTLLLIRPPLLSIPMKRECDLMQAFIGTRSLTLLLTKRIAEDLGLQNGDYLKCLIMERKYGSASSGRTNGLEEATNFD
jgi:hypothetical protein